MIINLPIVHDRSHFVSIADKDVYRTDREVDMYKKSDSLALIQLEDILTTYVIYNVDLGNNSTVLPCSTI